MSPNNSQQYRSMLPNIVSDDTVNSSHGFVDNELDQSVPLDEIVNHVLSEDKDEETGRRRRLASSCANRTTAHHAGSPVGTTSVKTGSSPMNIPGRGAEYDYASGCDADSLFRRSHNSSDPHPDSLGVHHRSEQYHQHRRNAPCSSTSNLFQQQLVGTGLSRGLQRPLHQNTWPVRLSDRPTTECCSDMSSPLASQMSRSFSPIAEDPLLQITSELPLFDLAFSPVNTQIFSPDNDEVDVNNNKVSYRFLSMLSTLILNPHPNVSS